MKRTISSLAAIACIFSASAAWGAPPFVERGITLPRHDWAFDVGLGIGHLDARDLAFGPDRTGAGFNLEAAVAVTHALELGLRTGLRIGDDGRLTHADEYGRLFDRQTFGTYYDTVADPEFRIRGALVQHEVVELALEGRAYLPVETNSYFGAMFGIPLMFHLGRRVRLDTGAYIPVLFEPRTRWFVSAPLDVWIQATNRLWLGPMTGVRVHNAPPGGDDQVDVSLGFGLGYQFAHWIDLKTMFLVPRINETAGARNFGAGVGVQMRIE